MVSAQPIGRSRSGDDDSPQRTLILEAAATVFNRESFGGASLEAIAAEAGLPVSDVEACFEDKHDILGGLVAMIQREATELFLITLPDELDIVGKLKLLLVHQAHWGNRRADALSFFGRTEPHKPRGRHYLNLDQYYRDGMVGWFERNDVASELDLRVPAEMAAHVFHALQVGFYERWVTRGGEESFLDNTEWVLDIFLNGVRKSDTGTSDRRS